MGVSPYLSIPLAPLHKGPGAECDRCPRTAAASPRPIRSSDVGRYRCATPEQSPHGWWAWEPPNKGQKSPEKKNRKQYGKAHIIVQWILEKPDHRVQDEMWRHVISISLFDSLTDCFVKSVMLFLVHQNRTPLLRVLKQPPTNGVAPPSQPPMILVHLPWPSRTPSE